jgi:hypothetical protein
MQKLKKVGEQNSAMHINATFLKKLNIPRILCHSSSLSPASISQNTLRHSVTALAQKVYELVEWLLF